MLPLTALYPVTTLSVKSFLSRGMFKYMEYLIIFRDLAAADDHGSADHLGKFGSKTRKVTNSCCLSITYASCVKDNFKKSCLLLQNFERNLVFFNVIVNSSSLFFL